MPANERDNSANKTSLVTPLQNCQCEGLNFYGMPKIEFLLAVDKYQTNFAYSLEPQDFEMLPKIDLDLRTSRCALGLWNLNENRDETSGDVNEFAVG